ncbi:hypothetical protein DIURU_005801 [Diutina rugosa]|uniref:Uncharacterized protein n=1 Tax=Diutina rugosa TaxID=5481 RepID=A0A642UBY0_DIURU|nr:uncharacterized protein DIURU_005801 [Diutina rugosa]KAA8896429.1 hypothetical protein DIURU_005801 [Diutina rugosa]
MSDTKAPETPAKVDTKATEAKETTKPAPATSESKKPADDDDLDDLDDMLDEFADDVLSKPPGSAVDSASQIGTTTDAQSDAGIDKQAGIAEILKDMQIDDPETQAEFAKLVEQFDTKFKDDVVKAESNPNNFEHVMQETMERLKKSGESVDEKIKNDPMANDPEALLTQLLSGMGDGDMDMQKLLVDMLEQLSSKEVLYEPIKDLNTKFPDYLKENKGKLNEDKYIVYEKQYQLTNEIMAVFDAPGYDDNNKETREKVNSLLESLQELGQPPEELVGDIADFPGFGGMGGPGDNIDFDPNDLPADVSKQMEECKQQ